MFSSTDGCGQREPPPGTNPSFLFLIPWPSPLFSQHTWSSPDNKPFGVMVPPPCYWDFGVYFWLSVSVGSCLCPAQRQHRGCLRQRPVTPLAWSHAWEPPGQPQACSPLCRAGAGWAPLSQPTGLALGPGCVRVVCTPWGRDGSADLQTAVPELAFSSCLISFLFAFKLQSFKFTSH